MTLKNPGATVGKVIAAGMLFAALGRQQYGYYTLLRWVVCGVAGFTAVQAAGNKNAGWAWTLGIVALVFNPFVPVRFTRDVWSLVDLTAAILLLVSIASVDRRSSPP
jgi:hypothetical protein